MAAAAKSPKAMREEAIKLYRALLKNTDRFPLKSRREIVRTEVQAAFRDPKLRRMSVADLQYKLVLGWERNAAIAKYAENMYWFHSRDEVTPQMMHYSEQRDAERTAEVNRCNAIGDASVKTEDVTGFKSVLFNAHPDYYNKIDSKPLQHHQDIWRARGNYGSDTGGPKQKFYVKRYKAVFPQGW